MKLEFNCSCKSICVVEFLRLCCSEFSFHFAVRHSQTWKSETDKPYSARLLAERDRESFEMHITDIL